MNVTGVEWRDLDPHDGNFFAGQRKRRARKAADSPEDQGEDIVEIHGSDDDQPGDGLDVLDESPNNADQRG